MGDEEFSQLQSMKRMYVDWWKDPIIYVESNMKREWSGCEFSSLAHVIHESSPTAATGAELCKGKPNLLQNSVSLVS